jgi:hypothetical protein
VTGPIDRLNTGDLSICFNRGTLRSLFREIDLLFTGARTLPHRDDAAIAQYSGVSRHPVTAAIPFETGSGALRSHGRTIGRLRV